MFVLRPLVITAYSVESSLLNFVLCNVDIFCHYINYSDRSLAVERHTVILAYFNR